MELLFKVDKQTIIATSKQNVATNSNNYLKCVFTFGRDWENVDDKYAIFETANNRETPQLDVNGVVEVPYSIIGDDTISSFTVGVFGEGFEYEISTAPITVEVEQGVELKEEDIGTPEEQENLYHQAIDLLEESQIVLEEAQDVLDEIESGGASSTAQLNVSDPLTESYSGASTTQANVNKENKSLFGQVRTFLQQLDSRVNAKLDIAGGEMTGGLSFGDNLSTENIDNSQHIILNTSGDGINVGAEQVNYTAVAKDHAFFIDGAKVGEVTVAMDTTRSFLTNGYAEDNLAPIVHGHAEYIAKTGDTMTGGLSINTPKALTADDLSKHLKLDNENFGINVTEGSQNYLALGKHTFTDATGWEYGRIDLEVNHPKSLITKEYLETKAGQQTSDVNGTTFSNGVSWNNATASNPVDTSNHITLYGSGTSSFGISVSSGAQNYIVRDGNNSHSFYAGGTLAGKVKHAIDEPKSLITKEYADANYVRPTGLSAMPAFWSGTQAEYDAIIDKDENTFYSIIG